MNIMVSVDNLLAGMSTVNPLRVSHLTTKEWRGSTLIVWDVDNWPLVVIIGRKCWNNNVASGFSN